MWFSLNRIPTYCKVDFFPNVSPFRYPQIECIKGDTWGKHVVELDVGMPKRFDSYKQELFVKNGQNLQFAVVLASFGEFCCKMYTSLRIE